MQTNTKNNKSQNKITIGLLYLNETNLGDLVIYDNTKYLINKICQEENIQNEIISLDIGENTPKSYTLTNEDIKEKEKNLNILKRYENKTLKTKYSQKKESLAKWYTTNNYYYLKNVILPKITNIDLLIFVGGGIIKFKRQNFHYIIRMITDYADKYNIPVILNSVGIEEYDKTNIDCQMLKECINKKCIKAITTRDDIELLNNFYITNKNIKTALTCDPAFYSKECYKVTKKTSNTIGIGLIRPKIFEEYMYPIKENTLLFLYKELIDLLLEKNFQVKIFTNGTMSDYKFQLKLQEYLQDNPKYLNIFQDRFTTSQELVTEISNYKTTIASRLHASIISYALDIPSIGLVWNKKQLLFGQIINAKNAFITKDNFDAGYICNTLEELLKNPPTITKEYTDSDYIFLKDELIKII